ncbi:NAD(P)/FAD-dependent oxidoreductase [Aquimarina brevivitae]|uniref:Glycine/D-amino acid oxidase-like deaminating enzyme n=1 Tax=Aquimarina brevivitae TaxID=323412 RepID=A0A4Q7PHS0_9FLAO|nr:FAD-dependent oxidoreductase [Aquimarina brevivitae]RZS99498.1 glycine/D-amino acid oxidase-like deaminating enzyme [Aquimarina brevivitae]
MNLSYWEYKSWLSHIDFTIIGSGITGLSCALQLRNKHPKANILILEKGMLPNGASTKNAGFACFGSISEILDDLKRHTEQEVIDLVTKRVQGLQLLRHSLGDDAIDYQQHGGFEYFLEKEEELYAKCLERQPYVNALLQSIFKDDVFATVSDAFGFKKVKNQAIYNRFEGQIDTGRMMEALLKKAQAQHIKILNCCQVTDIEDTAGGVAVKTSHFDFKSDKVFIATNGFAANLGIKDTKPARAQVLITTPIKDLHIKGTFHLDEGYYYFRNIENRILFGGGRNLDFKAEETTSLQQTPLIQDKLEEILKEVILPNHSFNIPHRWSGIMGVGDQKRPILKQLSANVYCGVRLGGMGVAIGSLVGKELADQLD